MSAPTMHDLLKFPWAPYHIIGTVLEKPLDHKHEPEIIVGLSTATKPVDRTVGSLFLETDTGKFYFWNGTVWGQPTAAAQSANLTFDNGANLVFGTGTGTKIGTATTQKIAFFNATPVTQRTGIANVNSSTVDATYDANESAVIGDLRTKVNAIIQVLEDMGITAIV